MIDTTVSHGHAETDNPTVTARQAIYRVLYYGYEPTWDTLEPILHSQRVNVLSYYRRRREKQPSDIYCVQTG